MSNKERYIVYPVLVILMSFLIGVITVGIENTASNIETNFEAYKFTYNHPNLVKGLSVKYASGSADLDAKLTVTEQSGQDKLDAAIANKIGLEK